MGNPDPDRNPLTEGTLNAASWGKPAESAGLRHLAFVAEVRHPGGDVLVVGDDVLGGRGAAEAIADGVPALALWDFFSEDDLRSRFVERAQVRVELTRVDVRARASIDPGHVRIGRARRTQRQHGDLLVIRSELFHHLLHTTA